MSEKSECQNDAIIGLLARSVFGINEIFAVVTRGKKNPRAYIEAYNSLDGTLDVTNAANIAGVKRPTMSVVLQLWEHQGIVYNTGSSIKPLYRRLLKLPMKLTKTRAAE
jgi:hypothetical protein